MPERVTRKSLLASPLQVLKCAFRGRRSRSGNMNTQASHSNRNQDSLSKGTFARTTCLHPPNTPKTPKPTTEASSSASTPTKNLRSVRGERIKRAVMLPPDTEDVEAFSAQAEEEGQGKLEEDDEEWISVSHKENESQSLTLHDISLPVPQMNMGEKALHANYSRLPTPVKPPTSNLYSHEMYQLEGRRSVLSSLGGAYTTGKRYEGADPKSSPSEDGHGVSSRSDSMHYGKTKTSEQRKSGLPLPQRGHGSERVQLRRTNVLPASTRGHGSSKPENTHKSLPVVVTGRPSNRVLSRKEVSHNRVEKQANPSSSLSSDPMSTDAADAPRSRSGEHQTEDQQPSQTMHIEDSAGLELQMQSLHHRSDTTPTAEAQLSGSNLRVLPRRVRLTNKFENLRAQNADKKEVKEEEKQSGAVAVSSFLKLA
ncbi:hypothetical protein AbraIFM66950_002658 [Aspergillus brasiliensis]|nr:hypothetical protein AbraIFM66950_002658 [Aspergillus brasiliensis]